MSQSPSAPEQPLFWLANPFSDQAVRSVWEPESANVASIHGDVFADLLRTVEQRRSGIRDRCLLLYGSAGSGKTHLIRRLRFALQADPNRPSVFSWARMQTSPAMMWRHLRRTLASDLILADLSGRRQIEHLLSKAPEQLDIPGNRDLSVILEHLAARRHQRDARAWLFGDRLPEAALQTLDVAIPDSEDEASEDESRRFLRDVVQLLAPVPVVVCLDQLEAMQSYPGDPVGLFAIGSLMAELHDNVPNAVVIGCIQTGLVQELDKTLGGAARDRYRTRQILPLTIEEARQLVVVRLDTVPEIARSRPNRASPFWPIQMEKIDKLAASPEGVTPRKVIFECDLMFQAAQGKIRRAVPVERFLEEEYQHRLRDSQRELTADTSAEVLSDALPRLMYVKGFKVRRDGLPPWVDHRLMDGSGSGVDIVIANDSPRAVWRKLDKIAREWAPAAGRLVIVRDSLNPLGPSAVKSRSRIKDLENAGAAIVSPSREALAALDAMRKLLADADSGDLAVNGESIPPATVEEWIRKQMPETLEKLGEDMIPASKPAARAADAAAKSELFRDLSAYMTERKVAAASSVAEALDRTAQEIEDCVRQNPESFGFAGGAEPVVFERLPFEAGA